VTTMQIYWGAVPFVVIQIIMVGLIIAFPGIVSSGLDKAEKIDLDKVVLEVQAEPAAPAASAPAGDASAATGDMPAAPADSTHADEDPMKAMQDAAEADAKKKK